LSSGKKRREHYVPRFYLDAFGDRLFVFDKQNGNDFKSGSKNIAFGKGFYDLGPEIDLEAVIAQIEGRLRNGISELIDKSHPNNISEDGRIRVSVFVALQYVRTEEFRAWLKESYEKLASKMIKSNPKFKDIKFKITMKTELARVLQAERIVDDTLPKLASILDRSRWALLLNNADVPFWTSDNPVALFNPIDYGDKSGIGFAVKGIQVHFPLNSKLLLLILDPRSYETPPVNEISDEELVIYENELELYNATRFVISSNDNFSLARKMWHENDALRRQQDRVELREIRYDGRSFIQLSHRMKTQHYREKS